MSVSTGFTTRSSGCCPASPWARSSWTCASEPPAFPLHFLFSHSQGLPMAYRLGVDVGGTFTDLLLFKEDTGAFWRHKTPSTPHDSSEGILNGLNAICEKASI